MSNVVKVSRAEMTAIVDKAAESGRIFRVVFAKKDFSLREMVCRTGVTKHLRDGATTYQNADGSNVGVYEISGHKEAGYKCFNKHRVVTIKFSKVVYTVSE
jgi:hypothetical protein